MPRLPFASRLAASDATPGLEKSEVVVRKMWPWDFDVFFLDVEKCGMFHKIVKSVYTQIYVNMYIYIYTDMGWYMNM